MSQYELALEYLLLREGGLKEADATDPGGITNRGISFRTLKEIPPERLRLYSIAIYVTEDTVRSLTIEQTAAFYKGEYWDHAPFFKIGSQDVINYLFDACIDMGLAPGIKCLQRAVWACRCDRACLVDDGILGKETLELVNGASTVILLSAMRSERGGEYRLIAERKPEEGKTDLDGWLNRSYNQST